MQIGLKRKSEPTGFVGLLAECHGRIREVTAVAQRLGAAEQAPEAEIAEAAKRVHRYFSKALPLHVRDEEETVLPRLLGREPALDAALLRMREEHREHEAPLGELIAACAVLAAEPQRFAALRPVVAAAAERLAREFEVHLAAEEALIAPAIARLLSAEEQRTMTAELRARRESAPVPVAGEGELGR